MTHKSFSVTVPTAPLQENFVALLHQIFITFRYQINVSLSGTRKYICSYCSTYILHTNTFKVLRAKCIAFINYKTHSHTARQLSRTTRNIQTLFCVCMFGYRVDFIVVVVGYCSNSILIIMCRNTIYLYCALLLLLNSV